ncbi:MAG: DoxX family protein [Phycisphaerales bacterium]|nr:DoxX family protein [Phycisphaerales bacterium]
MSTTTPASAQPKWMTIAGWIASVLPAAMLFFSASMKFAKPPAAMEGMAKFGYPESLLNTLGVVEVACTIVYLFPRTAVLGAVLLTGYLGGATATHVRVGDAWFMPVVLGVLVWLGLFLRDARVRALLPLRR